ncbi:hypothetical protein RHSIM_Rhsim01G0106000 [Rhododendron simsii]|uniref:ATP-dependent DNA helicase n=1 Tax=Rhododendron simsii TaxID=118357 RepID=A0A834HFK1_RHOSS|nr:hypothetical protein RHSIM_Rhsim01G0106000 [Rhododendron simsii]
MQHKYCVEAVDRTLHDIRDNPKPFGDITVVLGGDFRQILPVVPKGVRGEIVNTSLRRSDLWDDICVLTLNLNMRLNTTDPGNATFANFLMEVGTNPQEVVHLPSIIGKRYTYLAADKMSEDDGMDRSISNRYPNEYLNSLDPTGLPPFKLELKVGCPIILLRNIAPKDGLCNGTRMMVVRRQFPVHLAYAMTINKSQGQFVKFIGVNLRISVFSYGQLYVALSRCTSFDRIPVLLPKEEIDSTINIVYPEVLL